MPRIASITGRVSPMRPVRSVTYVTGRTARPALPIVDVDRQLNPSRDRAALATRRARRRHKHTQEAHCQL
jgi:hypothetical protein